MSKAVSPHEAKKKIPEFVIEAVNELIQENMDRYKRARVLQKDVKDRIKTKTDQDFEWAWLDFESIFEAEGWHVVYDRPAYCENYEAYFQFSPK